jgi:phosphoribosylcarboxyaminoimidazole (NCAIR) mutase
MIQVAVFLGSGSDAPAFVDSGAIDVLDKALTREGWALSFLSAHRHEEELRATCQRRCEQGATVFIAAVGLLPGLPGAILANLLTMGKHTDLVIGVALGSTPYEMDKTLSAMCDMPEGCPVMVAGAGKRGLVNAALAACSFAAQSNLNVGHGLVVWYEEFGERKPPQPDVNVEALIAKVRQKEAAS